VRSKVFAAFELNELDQIMAMIRLAIHSLPERIRIE
jgi:hypothetical protein